MGGPGATGLEGTDRDQVSGLATREQGSPGSDSAQGERVERSILPRSAKTTPPSGRPRGLPIRLHEYSAETITNRRFVRWDLSALDRFFLPDPLQELWRDAPLRMREFVEDDNRGAILPEPVATLDGQSFFLSVKGIGSTIDPYSWKPLDRCYARELSRDESVHRRLRGPPGGGTERLITGELWLRGSPYGGQGLEHAATALAVSERADLTSLEGFRIAPVLKIAYLPLELESSLKSMYWYRRFPGRIVQELRLVPSNVRVYFHARNTIGASIGDVFDQFGIDAGWKAHRFEVNFLRSGVAMLTLFSRTLRYDTPRDRYFGLDFHDVWLDKDAVVGPDGTVFFVDLEGIQEVGVERRDLREKVEDQIYRSLYELMFAYSQIDGERQRRFGLLGTRRHRLEALLEEALATDPWIRLEHGTGGLQMVIRNECEGGPMSVSFGMVDE